MKERIQEKIERIKKLAKESPLEPAHSAKKSSITLEDSLAKIITTQKAADMFMADLYATITFAQRCFIRNLSHYLAFASYCFSLIS